MGTFIVTTVLTQVVLDLFSPFNSLAIHIWKGCMNSKAKRPACFNFSLISCQQKRTVASSGHS